MTDVLKEPDAALEGTLRPEVFSEFTGQLKVKERLGIAVQAAKQRGEALDHILLSGPPGLGKTTLAGILAREMGGDMKITSGPIIEKAADLAGLLTNLNQGDVLFIDEIHRLQKNIEEYLYPAMEDFTLDIIIDQGPSARSVRLNLPRFTLIGATTRSGLLTAPLLTRFPVRERLDYYQADDLQTIVRRSARLLSVEIDTDGAAQVARRSRGTPRIANNLLRRVRDYAQVKGDGRIDGGTADKALAAGADKVGAEDLMEDMQNGNLDYDRVIATPDMMGVVGRLGKGLGPKGLMPNPKLGTVTPNVEQAVKDAKGGQVEFRVEKQGIIHSGIGKLSFKDEDLKTNFKAFTDAIVKAKPSGAKGKYLRKVTLTSSMGPGLKLDLAEVEGA